MVIPSLECITLIQALTKRGDQFSLLSVQHHFTKKMEKIERFQIYNSFRKEILDRHQPDELLVREANSYIANRLTVPPVGMSNNELVLLSSLLMANPEVDQFEEIKPKFQACLAIMGIESVWNWK